MWEALCDENFKKSEKQGLSVKDHIQKKIHQALLWTEEEAQEKLKFLQEHPRCDYQRVLEQCHKFEKEECPEFCNQGFSIPAKVLDLNEQKKEADKLLKTKRKQLITAYKDRVPNVEEVKKDVPAVKSEKKRDTKAKDKGLAGSAATRGATSKRQKH